MKRKKWLSALLSVAMVIALIPAAVFAAGTGTITNETQNKTYDTLPEALQDAQENDTITLAEGTYTATANEQLRIKTKGLTIKGADGTDSSKVIIDASTYSVSGQAGVMVEADDVTLEGLTITSSADNGNVSTVKFTKIADSMDNPLITAGTIKNVTLSSVKGHALNIHGVENMTVDGVNVTDCGKCSISIANSPNVTISNTKTGDGHSFWWSDIRIMYSANNPAYQNASHLVLGAGNDFGSKVSINSERPASSGSVDTIEATADSGLVITPLSNGQWTVTTDSTTNPAPITNVNNGLKYRNLAAAVKDATAGDTILLADGLYDEHIVIDKSITLKNAEGAKPQVADIAVTTDVNDLVFEGLTFVGASNVSTGDVSLSALYLAGPNLIKNVTVKDCDFKLDEQYITVHPDMPAETTIAITTLNVEGLTVEGCTIDGYTITAYHNPGNGGNIAYKDNTIKNVKSGIAFIATKGITVTGNTFENANGIRLESGWDSDDNKCTDVTIEQNKFLSVSSDDTYGQYAIRTENSNGVSGYEGTLELKENYWGENPDFDALVVGNVETNVYPYYVDTEMTQLVTAANGIAINYSAEMEVGETLQLTATVSPDNADDKTVTWSSSDDSIATVDQNGLVTAKAEGKVVITATNSAGQTATCNITVKAASTDNSGNNDNQGNGTASEVTPPSENGGSSTPQTGDFSNMMPWMVVMLLALSASVACVLNIKKNRVR